MGWWDDLNSAIADTGLLQAADPYLRDWVPGFNPLTNSLGMTKEWVAGGLGTYPKASDAVFKPALMDPINKGILPPLSGATMDWSDMGVPSGLSLTTTGRRRIMPYSGGFVPPGYRVANRPARAPQAGYPAGTYLVPRRSMNPLNPRALLRAERRMQGFTKWVKRHFRIAAATPRRKKTRSCGGYRRKK